MSQAKLPTLSNRSFDLVFGYVYTGLAVNLCLAVANLPLLAGLVLVKNPAVAWPFFVVISATLAPSVVGAFAAFEAANAGETSPFRDFWLGWRRGLRRSALVGATLVALELVIGLDLAVTAGRSIGALLMPPLVAVLLVAVVVATVLLAAVSRSDVPVAALARTCLFLAIRRWPLSLLTLACLGGAAAFALAQPFVGTLLGAAPLLFVAFSNCRVTLSGLAD